ncbi:hypothetical protein EHQ58_10650 [Leptospira ognonensis]|uniref:Uncharacterized protein n=1 Tax=Leptospira ognonensis TaxID=2484945 RepID=A0A4V3JQZ0_9LEPT|nr:hypothetical protein [Leptospira ognonensis]TGL57863.1 hypothetical protein EHQ58_10650 [Leptospira ognonensis]
MNFFKNETLKLWLHPDNGSFQLHSLEDEWNDWPYPHKMEYCIIGVLDGLDTKSPLRCSQDQITSYVYSTLIEDDLYYAQCEEIFHVFWNPNLINSEVEIIEEKQSGGPYGILNSSATYKCMLSKPYSLTIHHNGNKLEVEWPRFLKKWEKTSDGSELRLGLYPFSSQLIKEAKTE